MLSLILDFLLLAIGRKLLRENYSVPTNFRLELVEPSARVVEIRQFFRDLTLIRVSLGFEPCSLPHPPPFFFLHQEMNTSLADDCISSRRKLVDTLRYISTFNLIKKEQKTVTSRTSLKTDTRLSWRTVSSSDGRTKWRAMAASRNPLTTRRPTTTVCPTGTEGVSRESITLWVESTLFKGVYFYYTVVSLIL